MSRKVAKIPRTILSRTSKLLSAGVSVLGKEMSGRILAKGEGDERTLATRLRQAEELVETLGQMKGAAMKVGQLLAIELSDFLPPEVTQVLRRLHDDTTVMAPEEVRRILEEEWGGERLAKVKDLSEEPIASASIGQVHKALIDGQLVAIKIQFPGVAGAIDADLRMMRRLASSYVKLQGKKIALDATFEELAASLKDEVDYLKEADAVEAYGKAFAGDERYRVPEVLREYTTSRVLTLTFEEGERINPWLAREKDAGGRQIFGQMALELVIKEFFEIGLVQTDPNYGNFLYRPKERQIVLLDFGATRSYAPEFRNEIQALLRIAFSGDREATLADLIRMGFLNDQEGEEAREALLDMFDALLDMFTEELQPFDFADIDHLNRLRETAFAFLKSVRYSEPARSVMFVDRKFGGIYHLLKDVGCRLDLSEQWRRVMEMTFAD